MARISSTKAPAETGGELRQRHLGLPFTSQTNFGADGETPRDLSRGPSDDTSSASPLPSPTSSATKLNKWRLAGNTVKAQMRLQDMGLDLAFKEASLQRPIAERSPATPITLRRGRRPVFGDLRFSSGMSTYYCIVGDVADAGVFFDRVVNHPDVWNLDPPRLLLSIMGGAGNMNMDPAVENSFSEGLVRVAKQTGAWVVTGGTNSGVMALAGKAMGSHDKKRTVPCIGITSFGSLKSKWRAAIDVPHEAETSKTLRIVDAPSSAVDDDKMLPAIEENHTHSILCDGGLRGGDAFGQEAQFRANFEHHVAKMTRRATKIDPVRCRKRTKSDITLEDDNAHGAEAMRVMILLNGGAVSFESVALALEHECPVVVCRGSGRAADFLAELKDKPGMSFEDAWTMHMTAPPDKKQWEQRWGLDNEKGKGMLKKIVTSSHVVVYSHKDRLEDVVIGAVLQSIWANDGADIVRESLQQSLDMAVRWNCTKHCRDLCAKMVSGEDEDAVCEAISWIISRVTTREWVSSDASHIVKTLFELLPTGMRNFSLEDLYPDELKWKGLTNFTECENDDERGDDVSREGKGAGLPVLLLWLIENHASRSVIDIVWMQQDFPTHAALAAASCYRQMIRQTKYGRTAATSEGRLLEDEANRFETFAIHVVSALDRDRIDPVTYLFTRSQDWGGHNLVTLAHHLQCKSFIMDDNYVKAVDMLWFMPAPVEEYYFKRKERASLAGQSLLAIVRLAMMTSLSSEVDVWNSDSDDDGMLKSRDFWCVPKVKALTHSFSRLIFILCYSWFVLFSEGLSQTLLRLLLFLWGISLGLVEILQMRELNSLRDYLKSMWNVFDILLISLLLFTVLCEWSLVPFGILTRMDVHVLHALNLLPCYVRLLQILELSEYFGTLLITIVDMFVDTAHFMVLLFVVGLGFSCTLTPMLWPSTQERWNQGVFWTFWAIFGERDEKDNRGTYQGTLFGFLVNPLMYFLYLTLNVLLVNLLIAMLSDTYAVNKESSKRVWAFQCVDAVLEFASRDTHLLPPPLDLGISLHSLFFAGDHSNGRQSTDCCWKGHLNRQERRAMSQLLAKLLEKEAEGKANENETAEAITQLERRLRLCSGQLEKLGDVKVLLEEVKALRQENAILRAENMKLKDSLALTSAS